MTESKGDKEVLLTEPSEFNELRDFIYVNLKTSDGNGTGEVVNVKVRIQSSLQEELNSTMLAAAGRTMTMSKIFCNSKLLEKDSHLLSLNDLKDDLTLLATAGFSTKFKFKRFKKNYEWPYWGYYGTTTDGVCFVPTQNVVVCGFTVYATDQPSFELKYTIYVDDVVVEEED